MAARQDSCWAVRRAHAQPGLSQCHRASREAAHCPSIPRFLLPCSGKPDRFSALPKNTLHISSQLDNMPYEVTVENEPVEASAA